MTTDRETAAPAPDHPAPPDPPAPPAPPAPPPPPIPSATMSPAAPRDTGLRHELIQAAERAAAWGDRSAVLTYMRLKRSLA